MIRELLFLLGAVHGFSGGGGGWEVSQIPLGKLILNMGTEHGVLLPLHLIPEWQCSIQVKDEKNKHWSSLIFFHYVTFRSRGLQTEDLVLYRTLILEKYVMWHLLATISTNSIVIMKKLIKPDNLPPIKKVPFLQKCGSLVVGFLEVRKQLAFRELLVSTPRIQVRTGSYFSPTILFPCINTHFVSWMEIQYTLDVFDWGGKVT